MRLALILSLSTAITACASRNIPLIGEDDSAAPAPIQIVRSSRVELPQVEAVAETAPVGSSDDAADDPAIWVHADDPSQSLILGTDKRAGIYVYNLAGEEQQFLPLPQPNNIDLRQGLITGTQTEYVERWDEEAAEDDCADPTPYTEEVTTETVSDIAVTSNRGDNTVSVLSVSLDGVRELGRFSTVRPEPYGICMGVFENTPVTAVTHKNGMVDLYGFTVAPNVRGQVLTSFDLGIQLEGCVFDEENGTLFVGKEESGISVFALSDLQDGAPQEQVIDRVDGETGLAADIEGLTLYRTGNGTGYLIASSQGNNSFAVYDRQSYAFLGRFAVGDGEEIDGAEETDGIDVTSALLNEDFPTGVLVVQDGFNDGGPNQNFKLIPWQRVARVLGLI